MHPNSILANKRNLLKGRISNALNAVTQVERLWDYTPIFSHSYEFEAIEYNSHVSNLRARAEIVYRQIKKLEQELQEVQKAHTALVNKRREEKRNGSRND